MVMYLYLVITSNDNLFFKFGKNYELVVYLSYKHVIDLDLGKFESLLVNVMFWYGILFVFNVFGVAWELRM